MIQKGLFHAKRFTIHPHVVQVAAEAPIDGLIDIVEVVEGHIGAIERQGTLIFANLETADRGYQDGGRRNFGQVLAG